MHSGPIRRAQSRDRGERPFALGYSPRARDRRPDASRSKGRIAPVRSGTLCAREIGGPTRHATLNQESEKFALGLSPRDRDLWPDAPRSKVRGDLLRSGTLRAREIGGPTRRA